MSLADTQCHSKEFLSIVFIIGSSSHWPTVLNFIFSPMVIHTATGLWLAFLSYGQSCNSATTSVMLCYQVLEESRKKATNMKTHPKKEESHMDGASALFHALIISGKLLDGSYSPSLQEHGQLTYSLPYRFTKWPNGLSKNMLPIKNNLPINIQKEEKLSSHSLFDWKNKQFIYWEKFPTDSCKIYCLIDQIFLARKF